MLLSTKVKKKILGVNVKLNIFPGLNQLYVYEKGMEKKGEEEHKNFRKEDWWSSWEGRQNDILKNTFARQILCTKLCCGKKSVPDTHNSTKNIHY